MVGTFATVLAAMALIVACISMTRRHQARSSVSPDIELLAADQLRPQLQDTLDLDLPPLMRAASAPSIPTLTTR
ncbi:hypothetical protein AC579_5562 [Pseudocercospora musae]|uniref:Uncharacterized protein n=1 Tax=Pseudocercospora musae TaxID=113226 RepID=A0A139I9L5_9PEZI|nr:hypothetical protein AC579_5562 [Pseudocercospora musae]